MIFRSAKVLLFLLFFSWHAAVAQTPSNLPNGDFENGSTHWVTRTDTAGAYNIAHGSIDGSSYAELTVVADAPAKDKESIYFSRADLPTAPGYYRLSLAMQSELKQGIADIRVVGLDADGKVLLNMAPGMPGVPQLSGNTPWTDYSLIYQVPENVTLLVLQLQVDSAIGKAGFDNVRLEKLDEAMGKQLWKAQKDGTSIAPFKQVPERVLKNPLKTKKMIFTDDAVALARENVLKYPQAQKVRDIVIAAADKWVNWSDADLISLMPSAQVPRAFDLNAHGDPVNGDAVFKYGTYPWIIDPRHPFQVESPVDHKKYPSNDYATYLKSGFKDRTGMDQKYADDGWGWEDPKTGERYWFVAYANHWMWRSYIGPAMLNLSAAYVLTGDKRYAHKAAVMLYRLAEVYPSMDLDKQSRYGQIMHAQGGTYPGKVLNNVWETEFARDFARDYDAIWDTIDSDANLQKSVGKTGEQIRSFIEANLLEDAIDAYFTGQIEGNFGMHQNALLNILLARQNIDLQKYFHLLVDEPGKDLFHTGLRYALYNLVWRDGIAFESPGYNNLWVNNIASLSYLLQRGGFNLFSDPKLSMLFDGQIDFTAIGKFTPDLGDSGSVFGGIVGRDADTYQIAYNAYKKQAYLEWMASDNATGPNTFKTFDSLFLPMLPSTAALPDERATEPQKSRLFAGYGFGILNNAQDSTALALAYGQHLSHYHRDFLSFDLFANGQKMMPDLGYPDAMNTNVSEVWTWSANTISHNTVVVDAAKQSMNLPGTIHDFSDGSFARDIDASSPAYPQTSQYRRNMIMVDVDSHQSYVVDVFRVDGGKEHDYSLHGPPGTVTALGGQWSTPAPGTLAGENVKWGQLYDDATMGAAGYSGPYNYYQGSGFQYLYNVQELKSGRGDLQYSHAKDARAQLRIHLLPYQDQKVFMADAYDLPRAKNNTLKYLIARRNSPDGSPLKSTFVSVLEPFSDTSFITSAKTVNLTKGSGVAVEVQRQNATEIILSDPTASAKVLSPYGLETDAQSAVVTLDGKGVVQRVFFSGGSYLNCKGNNYSAPTITGKVLSVNPQTQNVVIQLDQPTTLNAAEIARRLAHFSNQYHVSAHPVESATLRGNQLTLKVQDSLLVGRMQVSSSNDNAVFTETVLPLSDTYNGTTLLDKNYQEIARVKNVESGKVTIVTPLATAQPKGADIWFSDVGVGDRIKINSLFDQ